MEKTAVKPPWKSLRDSHFPHSPGDDGAFHFTKNTSSAESAIHPQISRTKHLFELLGEAFRVLLSVHGSQLALDGLHIKVLVDVVNLAILNMKDEAALEVISLPGGFDLDRRKVCLVG